MGFLVDKRAYGLLVRTAILLSIWTFASTAHSFELRPSKPLNIHEQMQEIERLKLMRREQEIMQFELDRARENRQRELDRAREELDRARENRQRELDRARENRERERAEEARGMIERYKALKPERQSRAYQSFKKMAEERFDKYFKDKNSNSILPDAYGDGKEVNRVLDSLFF